MRARRGSQLVREAVSFPSPPEDLAGVAAAICVGEWRPLQGARPPRAPATAPAAGSASLSRASEQDLGSCGRPGADTR